ncbi:MAG: glycosyltransferase [Hyphomicrobiales bacterium]|nr:MAG: glycosyltransferase [Hyphomicrobiales bacterium]
MSEIKARLALDMYVLAQGVRTGIYRVCDELFPLLVGSPALSPRLLYRSGYELNAAAYLSQRQWTAPPLRTFGSRPADGADILLSPFGVAPDDWLRDEHVLKAHIVYDLIGIKRPEFFSEAAADEVRRIVESLDEHTVVFAISEHTKSDLLQCRPDLSPNQITVIPLAAGKAFRPCTDSAQKLQVRMRYGIPAEVPYVLSLATLEVRKNLDKVVEAFARHLTLHPESPIHLVLSGMPGWKLEQLECALTAAGKWRERIVITGFVEEEHLSALYSDALCFVYLSRYEGFGLPPLEAMACGTPVVSADNSSLPEVVGSAGLLFNSGDVDGVADAIERLMQSGALRAELSAAGIRRAQLFDWERCAAIVAGTLVDAYAAHAKRPYNRRARELAPGAVPTQFGQHAQIEANVLDYQNGSVGPAFHAIEPTERRDAAWPSWCDALPKAEASSPHEGGLRTRGTFKSGSFELPLVTYVTVVRNNTKTLERTIQSVQAQTWGNVEHIILDGASTDGTLDLVRKYEEKIDYFASEPDKNLYDALNKAIPLARGELICVLNSDDWLEPRAAEIAVHRLRGQPDAALLFTTAHVQLESDKVFEWNPSFVQPGCYFSCANDCHNGIYAMRAAYERTGPYDSSYKIAADFKWIMTSLDAGLRFVYTREPTVNYSMGGTSGDVRQHSAECIRVVRERFPFLQDHEVSGLYHCFFELAGDVRALEPNRPADLTEFVRRMFATHRARPDFVSSLTWAMMAKFVHPAAQPHRTIALEPSSTLGVRAAFKQLVKSILIRSPRLYTLAGRVMMRLRS